MRIEAKRWWASAITRLIGWILGIRGEAKLVLIRLGDDEMKPTINDIIKNQQEDEMNQQVEKETGE